MAVCRLQRRCSGPELGGSKRVAADHYVYALVDYREVERRLALERIFR
jgi:hypothetical protein